MILNTARFLFMMRDENHHERRTNQDPGAGSSIPRRDRGVDLTIDAKEDRYAWIQRTLIRFRYRQLGKTDKGLLLGFLQKVSSYSRLQIKRLVRQSMKTGTLKRRQRTVHGV